MILFFLKPLPMTRDLQGKPNMKEYQSTSRSLVIKLTALPLKIVMEMDYAALKVMVRMNSTLEMPWKDNLCYLEVSSTKKEVWLIEVPSSSSPTATFQPQDEDDDGDDDGDDGDDYYDDDDTSGNTLPWWCYIWSC
mmetsp:Transcript_30111/g.45430  ORF Transcript_30111/g.45430 Transcript_30111/m.45430 type:complete len:136 (-) Transcript_30111:189-596(-)